MNKLTETGRLPIGVEYEGTVHRDFEIGPRLVKHMIAASGDVLFETNKNAYEVCCLAAQIIRLGGIPKEAITGSLLGEMDVDDFDALTEAAEKVRQRTRSFRKTRESGPAHDTGPAEAGLQSG